MVEGRGATGGSTVWAAGELLRDPIVRLQLAAVAIVAAPFFVPRFSTDQLWSWSVMTELPLLVITLAAFRLGFDRLTDPAERRFWNLWSVAILAWTVKAVAAIATIRVEQPSIGFEVALNCVFFLFYFMAAMALESRPNLSESALASALRVVERLGTFVFFIGLLLYLSVVPAILDPENYISSSLLMYVILDAYLIIRLGIFLGGTRAPEWRRTYLWMLVTACLWLVTDGIEMLSWAGPLDWIETGSPVDLMWLPGWVTLVAAARTRHVPVAVAAPREQRLEVPLGPLVACTVAMPIIHLGFSRAGWADGELRPYLEVVALAVMLALAALVVVRQELLRNETRRLEAERARDRRQIEHLAFHDSLTGVPNRRLMTDRLEVGLVRALRFRRKLAVLLLDIDDFKRVNDTMGHDAGDQVLKQVAERLQGCVRGGDTIARFGGDEFVAIIEGLVHARDAGRVLESIEEVLAEPFEVGEDSIEVHATIGLAVFPDQGTTPDELLKEADAEMYRRRHQQRQNQVG